MVGGNDCVFPPPPLVPINRSGHTKFRRGLIAYFKKEKTGFVAWHEVGPWEAYAGEVPKSWEKDEPMAKAHVLVPSMHGETFNARPPVKRKRPETSVVAFALPLPYLKNSAPQ